MPAIVQIREWPAAAIAGLLAASEQEGFKFVRRAREEWQSGANRFSEEGEALFGVFEEDRLLAIGGINREFGGCGRLRRCYVRRDKRRRGLGRRLVRHLLAFACGHYARVVLRCDTAAADRFYRALGFRRTASVAGVTHVIELTRERTPRSAPKPGAARPAAAPADRDAGARPRPPRAKRTRWK